MGGAVEKMSTKEGFLSTFASATEENYNRYLKEFEAMRTDDLPTVSHASWTAKFSGMPAVLRSYMEMIFKTFDVNKDGRISREEWLLFCGVNYHGTPEQKIRATFRLYDEDCNGHIDANELQAMLICVAVITVNVQAIARGNTAGVKISTQEAEELKKMAETIMKELDTDKSGTLEIEEVVRGCTARPKLLKIFSSI